MAKPTKGVSGDTLHREFEERLHNAALQWMREAAAAGHDLTHFEAFVGVTIADGQLVGNVRRDDFDKIANTAADLPAISEEDLNLLDD